MFRKISRGLVLVLLAGSVAMTPSCSDFAVGLTTGIVAVGVGAALIGHHYHHPRCHAGYRTECTQWRDYWGVRRTSCRDVYDSCAWRSALGATADVNKNSISSEVADIAQNMGVSFEAADTLYTAVARVAGGDMTAIGELGLSADDMARLVQGTTLSDESLKSLSLKLNLEPVQTAAMVQKIAIDLDKQRRDVDSPYWQACLNAGSTSGWHTDANNGTCRNLNWPGCSPSTGATFCTVQ